MIAGAALTDVSTSPAYRLIVVIVAVAIAGCGDTLRQQPAPDRAIDSGAALAVDRQAPDTILCDSCAVPGVKLSPYERCALNAYVRRSEPTDTCMFRCLSRGQARNIGGGCWHACYAYRPIPMISPPGLDRCGAVSRTPVDTSRR